MTDPKTLKKMLEERIGLPCKETRKYTNFYMGGRVKLQLHPNPLGVDLAIPEAAENPPSCKKLKHVDIKSLHGYWGSNKDWLEGNGKRFTKRAAVAFHLPEEMKEEGEGQMYWQDFHKLQRYAIESHDKPPDDPPPKMNGGTKVKRRKKRVDLSGRVFVVDGLNVIRSYSQKSGSVSFEALLSLLLELKKSHASFLCMFDANTYHVLREKESVAAAFLFRRLVDSLPQYFSEVTGGIQADPFILMHADDNDYPIISNDKFTTYDSQYPWILKDANRLIKGKIVGDKIMVPSLGISIPIDKHVELMVDKLIDELKS